MMNQAGSFGPWNFGGTQDPTFENRILPGAAFHVREQTAADAPLVRTLATRSKPWDGLSPAFQTLDPGDGTYAALYPFGWTTYDRFADDVSMRFWSPIVAGEDERTSMPVAFLDVRVANHTSKPSSVSVMLTMPNAPDHDGGSWQNPPKGTSPATVRQGLRSTFDHDDATGVDAVTLSASDPANTPDAQDSEWTIAARPQRGQHLSYTTSWDAAGDGSDVYGPFSAAGQLPNAAIDGSSSAGAIAVSVALHPGEVATIPFAVAWDFPLTNSPNSAWGAADQWFMRRYTEFFGARTTDRNDYITGSYPFHQGFEIADRMLSGHDAALQAVEGWWGPIVSNTSYPAWLVRESLNELVQPVFNDAFWALGLVTPTPSPPTRIGAAIPGTHLFCTSTGGGWGGCNEWDTDAHGYVAEGLLWPNLERDRLRGVLQGVLQGGQGVDGATATAGSVHFQDEPNKTIFRAYALYRRTHDDAFLRYAYPAMRNQFEYLRAGIKPGDHIPPDYPGQSSTYDVVEVVGHGVYNAGLWLLTEEIMADATAKASALGVAEATPDVSAWIAAELPQAKAEFETLFWDPVGGHYKIDPAGSYGDGIFSDTLFAQHVATTLGLPSLLDDTHVLMHLRTAYPQLMQTKDGDGHYIGPPLVVPQVGPPFPPPCAEICEVWQGTAVWVAAAYVSEGKRLHAPDLVADGLTIGQAVEYQTTENVSNGFLFDAPEGWYANDTHVYRSPGMNRSRAALDLLHTVAPVVPAAFG